MAIFLLNFHKHIDILNLYMYIIVRARRIRAYKI